MIEYLIENNSFQRWDGASMQDFNREILQLPKHNFIINQIKKDRTPIRSEDGAIWKDGSITKFKLM